MAGRELFIPKPTAHLGEADWIQHNYDINVTSDGRLISAFDIRYETQQARNEAEIQAKCKCRQATAAIDDRIHELTILRMRIAAALERLQEMMKKVHATKKKVNDQNERVIKEKVRMAKFLGDREKRREHELSLDSIDTEFKKEGRLLSDFNIMLQDNLTRLWECLNIMDEYEFGLIKDLERRDETLAIENEVIQMSQTDKRISHKVDPYNISRAYKYEVSIQKTNDLLRKTHDLCAEADKNNAVVTCSALSTENTLKAQRDATNGALRKHLHDLDSILKNLAFQKQQLVDGAVKLGDEFMKVQNSLNDNDSKMKLTETRMDLRQERPTVEQAIDDVSKVLLDQLNSLKVATKDLSKRMDCIRTALYMVQIQITQIDEDMELKKEAYDYDLSCYKELCLEQAESCIQNDTDRNLHIFSLENNEYK